MSERAPLRRLAVLLTLIGVIGGPVGVGANPFARIRDKLGGWVGQGLKGELGLLVGGASFSSNSGLGNAHFADDVPDGGFAYGLRGGLLLGPSKEPRFALDIELRLTHPELRHARPQTATAWAWRAMGRYLFGRLGHAGLLRRVQPFVCAGAGQEVQIAAKDFIDLSDFDAALVLGGGTSVRITHRLLARVDARWVLTEPRPDAGADVTFGLSNTFELQLGLAYLVGGPPPDEDDDGVYEDGRDKCPEQPEDRDGFEDDDGCPDTDNDGDGLLDALDRCPDEAEDKDGFQDDDGCPDPDNDGDGVLDLMDKCRGDAEDRDGFEDGDGCPDPDNDRDGLPDKADRCPNAPEDKDGFEDGDGCPDPDNDGDGVPDRRDKCPDAAEDYDGFEDGDGCPDTDNDGDGVPDRDDRCPLKPEVFNGYRDRDGCPDTTNPEIRALLRAPVAGIVFSGDKVEPTASELGLQRMLGVMRRNPGLRLAMRCPVGEKAPMGTVAARTRSRCGSIEGWLAGKGIRAGRLRVITETGARGRPGTSVLELRSY